MIWIVLLISVALNILCIWYIRNILKDYFYVLENLEDLFDVIDVFSAHLESVHALETFYGEPTLQNLIKHSKDVVGEIDTYKRALLVDEENEDEEYGQEETEEDN
jgi:hypothetical protein